MLGGFLYGPFNNEHQHARLRMREGEGHVYGMLSSSSILEHHLRLKVVMDKCYFLVTFMEWNLSLALCRVNDSRSWIGATLPSTILELLSYYKPF